MGTPIPPYIPEPPVAPGVLCNICWGASKTFDSDETPEIIYVTFEGIEKSIEWGPADGEPIDGKWELPQVVGSPCIFFLDNPGNFSVLVRFFENATRLLASSSTGEDCFISQPDIPCLTVLGNKTLIPFTGGTGVIEIPEIL